MNKKCPQCQSPLVETQRFCRFCGYRLDEGVQDYVQTQTLGQPTSSAPQSSGYTAGYTTWTPPAVGQTDSLRQRRRWGAFWVLLSLVLAAAIGGGIVFFSLATRSVDFAPGGAVVAPLGGGSYLGVYFEDAATGGAFLDGIANDGGPADEAGLIGGDVIIQANGVAIGSTADMRRVLRSTPPGSEIKIKYLRDKREMETTLLTGARRDFSSPPVRGPYGFFGIDPDALGRVAVAGKDIYGVRLGRVIKNGPADLAGILTDDIVIQFDGHPIRTPREFLRRIRQSKPRSTVELKIMRRGEELTIPVKLGQNDG